MYIIIFSNNIFMAYTLYKVEMTITQKPYER